MVENYHCKYFDCSRIFIFNCWYLLQSIATYSAFSQGAINPIGLFWLNLWVFKTSNFATNLGFSFKFWIFSHFYYIILNFKEQRYSFEVISAIEEIKTFEKLGSGGTAFSIFGNTSDNHNSDGRRYKIESIMRKLKNMGGTDEHLNTKLIAFKHLFGRIGESRYR